MKVFPDPTMANPSECSIDQLNNLDNYGMDLRDYFAGLAMQGLISDHDSRTSVKEYAKSEGHSFAKEVSIQSYDLADAMIKQRGSK